LKEPEMLKEIHSPGAPAETRCGESAQATETSLQTAQGRRAAIDPFEQLATDAMVDAGLLAQHCVELAGDLYGDSGDIRALALQSLLARVADLCEIATAAMRRDADSLESLQCSLCLKPGRDWIGRQGENHADAKARAPAQGAVQ
jgi:hypothetical protein